MRIIIIIGPQGKGCPFCIKHGILIHRDLISRFSNKILIPKTWIIIPAHQRSIAAGTIRQFKRIIYILGFQSVLITIISQKSVYIILKFSYKSRLDLPVSKALCCSDRIKRCAAIGLEADFIPSWGNNKVTIHFIAGSILLLLCINRLTVISTSCGIQKKGTFCFYPLGIQLYDPVILCGQI